MKLDDIFREADQIIEKRASVTPKETVKEASVNDEVVDIAESLLKGDFDDRSVPHTEKIAMKSPLTAMEKVAHSMAIVDTLLNIGNMAKLEKVAEIAEAEGYSPKQVADYIEKKASEMPMVSVAALIKENLEGVESEKTAGIRQSVGKLWASPKVRGGLGLAASLPTAALAYGKGGKDRQNEIRKALQDYHRSQEA